MLAEETCAPAHDLFGSNATALLSCLPGADGKERREESALATIKPQHLVAPTLVSQDDLLTAS